MRIDVFFHDDHRDSRKLDEILTLLKAVKALEEKMSVELDDLTIKVEETKTVEDSAIVLLNGLAAQIAAIKDDPVKIAALAASLKAKSDELAAAVIANTPAA